MKEGFLDGSIGADIPKEEMSVFFNVNNLIVSQMNIHIVPFVKLYSFGLTGTNRFYLSKILKLTSRLILSELRMRIQQLNSINLIPQKLMFFAHALMQDYTGDVTIFPKLTFSDIFKLLDLNRDMVRD